MYLISHRGNLNGIQKDMENKPEWHYKSPTPERPRVVSSLPLKYLVK